MHSVVGVEPCWPLASGGASEVFSPPNHQYGNSEYQVSTLVGRLNDLVTIVCTHLSLRTVSPSNPWPYPSSSSAWSKASNSFLACWYRGASSTSLIGMLAFISKTLVKIFPFGVKKRRLARWLSGSRSRLTSFSPDLVSILCLGPSQVTQRETLEVLMLQAGARSS